MGFDLYGSNPKTEKANTFATMFGGGDDQLNSFASTQVSQMIRTKRDGNTMTITMLHHKRQKRLLNNFGT